MAYHVFGRGVLDLDDDLFLPGRAPDCYTGSEMRIRNLIFAVVLSLWATPAFSQGCAMCASYGAATSKEGQRALGKAVLLLLVPPAGFMSLGVAMAYRYGRKRDLEQI